MSEDLKALKALCLAAETRKWRLLDEALAGTTSDDEVLGTKEALVAADKALTEYLASLGITDVDDPRAVQIAVEITNAAIDAVARPDLPQPDFPEERHGEVFP